MGILNKFFGVPTEVSSQYVFKELSQQFIDALAETVARNGFRRRGNSYAFNRERPSGADVLHFPISKYEGRFVVLPSVGIRFDELEEFINRYAVNRDIKQVKHKSSIGMTLGELATAKEPLRWSIRTPKDINKSLLEIEKLIQKFGFLYFNQFQSLEDLYEVICKINEKGHVHGNEERAIYCVALAHLTSHADDITEIVQQWRNVFQENNDPSAQFFEGFYQNYLKKT